MNKYKISKDLYSNFVNASTEIMEEYATALAKELDIKVMQELVERATPKKVVNGKCPNCDEDILNEYYDYMGCTFKETHYCPNCGSKLDWSE